MWNSRHARRPCCAASTLAASLLAASSIHAAEEPVHRLTLKEAAAHALEKHPAGAVAASKEQVARARVDVARAEAVPRVSLVAQVNRSTGNVVPGASFAMTGLPGVAGPPGQARFGSGAWQTVAGITAGWDVLELVRRPSIVDAAGAEVAAVKAQSSVTQLEIVARAADAYLVVAEARALVTAAEASEKRTKTFHDVVDALVTNKLRPDLDLARADTDLSSARVIVEKTKLGVTVTSVQLASAIGEPGWTIEIVDTDFSALPPAPGSTSATHPAIVAYEEAAKASEARASAARLAYLPKIEILGAAWLRGGGYVLGGPNSGDAAGLLPDTPNWALGLAGTWTPTDIPAVRAKASVEEADASVHRAKAAEAAESISSESKVARASLSTALAVAGETSKAVAAARKALDLANTRYTTGNGNVVEVVDAERALAAAERDDAVARLEAWRALAAVYRAHGNLEPLTGPAGAPKG